MSATSPASASHPASVPLAGRDLAHPTKPSRAVQELMAAETARRHDSTPRPHALPEESGAPTALRARLREIIESLRPEIIALSRDIHTHPEVGYTEHYAARAVADLLARHGIEASVGVFGMDTALRAELTPAQIADAAAHQTPDPHPGARLGESGQPAGADTQDGSQVAGKVSGGSKASSGVDNSVAILAEYDALPGIGHACGHNVMCANSVGAFLALAELERAHPGSLPGRVVLQTTPAEENDTAKERLALAGMLEGIDAAIQTHSYAHDVVSQPWLGVRRLRAVFTGIPAHAASQPFMGRNALDAATLALTGFGLLRQQITPWDRLHAVIVDGGQVANIIPERTEISLFVRSKYAETLKDLVHRVEDVLRGAALMTGTGLEIITPEYCNEMPVRDNGPLLAAWTRAQRAAGREPLAAGVLPETVAAGTDFGNVSQRIPGIHPLIKVTDREDIALHTREMAAAAGSETGDRAAVDGAWGLASVALDWLHDSALREAVREDFEASGGAVDVANFWKD